MYNQIKVSLSHPVHNKFHFTVGHRNMKIELKKHELKVE